MIQTILDGLKLVKQETELIKIAKGKYKLPVNLLDGIKEIKTITNGNRGNNNN